MKTLFFLFQIFSSPMGYLASIMFQMPRQYSKGVSRDLKCQTDLSPREGHKQICLFFSILKSPGK